MPETYGYVRTSRPRVSELSGSDPETQPMPAVAGCRCGAFSHLSGRRHLRDLRYQQPAGLALSGFPAGPGRHLGCDVHRPHRSALAGHHEQRPRSSTARGEDSQPGRQRTVLGPLPGCRPRFARVVLGLYPGRFRRRTKAGLETAKAGGQKLGARRRLSEEQEAAVIEMVASGVSQRRVASSFGVSSATVRRAVKRK